MIDGRGRPRCQKPWDMTGKTNDTDTMRHILTLLEPKPKQMPGVRLKGQLDTAPSVPCEYIMNKKRNLIFL